MLLGGFGNLFGIGGGSLISRLLGRGEQGNAGKIGTFVIWASSIAALAYSFLIFGFGGQALRVLGTGGETLRFAEQYLFWTVVTGGIPMESGSCQYCPCSGTGRDSGYRDVGRQNSKCAA